MTQLYEHCQHGPVTAVFRFKIVMHIRRKTLRFLPWAVMLCLCCYSAGAQDIHLSQFYETPILRNPALAGIFTGDYRVGVVYRNQWSSITTPYQTGTASGEFRFPIGNHNDYLTGGLQLAYDVAGSAHFRTSQLLPVINYHKSLNDERDMYLSVGFMAGFTQRQFDPARATFDNQYTNGEFDPTAPSGETMIKDNFNYLDMATGLSFSNTIGEDVHWFVGAAFYHFNKPKVSFLNDKSIELSEKWEYNAGVSAPLGDFGKVILEYNQLKQGTYSEVMAGGLVGYTIQLRQGATAQPNMIYGGVMVRWNDAIVPVVRLDLGSYSFGFSYDVNVSKLAKATQSFGGYELSMSYRGFFSSGNSSSVRLRCPRF